MKARAFIERRLADPELSVTDIAQAMNRSQRHLSRIFSAADTTVAQMIQQQRFEHARVLLTAPESAHLTAAEVAMRSGFASASHFSRVCRAHFGMSPTEIRRASATAPVARLAADAARVAADTVEQLRVAWQQAGMALRSVERSCGAGGCRESADDVSVLGREFVGHGAPPPSGSARRLTRELAVRQRCRAGIEAVA